MMKVVLDMHGTVYSHVKTFSLPESELIYEKTIQQLRNEYPEKTEQELEYLSIQRGLNNSESLQLYYLPQFVENSHWIFNKSVYVFSNSLIETSQLVLMNYFRNFNKTANCAPQNIQYFNSAEYGSKKDASTWMNFLKEIGRVYVIYEDKYHKQAETGACELNMQIKVLNTIAIV